MRRRTALLILPLAASCLAFSAGPVAADCATDGLAWPDRGAAEGTTFTGEVVRKVKTAGDHSGYRFAVDHVYAGELDGRVDVAIVCVGTTFAPGERYLVSSAGWAGSADDLEVGTVKFTDHSAVAWHVDRSGGVELVDFGAGTDEAPAYLRTPETLKQAVHAVTLGDLPPTDTAQAAPDASVLRGIGADVSPWLLTAWRQS